MTRPAQSSPLYRESADADEVPSVTAAAASTTLTGGVFALLAYGSWGLLPVYWKALEHVPASEILAHRVLWSLAFTALLLSLAGQWTNLRGVLGESGAHGRLALSALLIGANWLLYIWAVNGGQVLATSLGYFLTPLLNVALGVVFLRERLRPWQIVAVSLAGVGVAYQAFDLGALPWISLGLALSFSVYGLLRKVAPVGSLPGLAAETLILAPFALGYLLFREAAGAGALSQLATLGATTALLLVGAGVATAAPLLWFAGAARRLRLATVGLFQYIAPSLSFLLAVGLYDEAFTRTHAVTFGCIWLALLLYSGESVRAGVASSEA